MRGIAELLLCVTWEKFLERLAYYGLTENGAGSQNSGQQVLIEARAKRDISF